MLLAPDAPRLRRFLEILVLGAAESLCWFVMCFLCWLRGVPARSKSYVELYNLVRGPATRKDFFFGRYADAISQAVLYSMFLASARTRWGPNRPGEYKSTWPILAV